MDNHGEPPLTPTYHSGPTRHRQTINHGGVNTIDDREMVTAMAVPTIVVVTSKGQQRRLL